MVPIGTAEVAMGLECLTELEPAIARRSDEASAKRRRCDGSFNERVGSVHRRTVIRLLPKQLFQDCPYAHLHGLSV